MNRRTAVFMDGLPQKALCRELSQPRVIVQVTDDLAADRPEVVHLLSVVFQNVKRSGIVLLEIEHLNSLKCAELPI